MLAEARVERSVNGIPTRRTTVVVRIMVVYHGKPVDTLIASNKDCIQPTGVKDEARPRDFSVPNSRQ